jgi:hypothetical protein
MTEVGGAPEALARALDAFRAHAGADPLGFNGLALRLGVLPVVRTWETCLALRPDSRVVSFGYAEDATAQLVLDQRVINQVWHQANLRIPGLVDLAPIRPPEAGECPYCGGTGTATEVTQDDPALGFCYCGGLGWLPPGDPALRRGR